VFHLQVNIHNDGKQKRQSYEAYLDGKASNIVGYGASEAEAVENLKIEVANYIMLLQTIDYSNTVQVDCSGEPLFDRENI